LVVAQVVIGKCLQEETLELVMQVKTELQVVELLIKQRVVKLFNNQPPLKVTMVEGTPVERRLTVVEVVVEPEL
jgi:hypothetical protein